MVDIIFVRRRSNIFRTLLIHGIVSLVLIKNASVVFQATAFVVDAEKGYLLTAAHTFGTLKKRGDDRKASWKTDAECPKEACIILVRERGTTEVLRQKALPVQGSLY